MSKTQLRDEAKGLLLKGCYRMAFNKYARLIEMGSEGFTQREWAVIHLNQGICLQFQEQFDKAIDNINRSIQIDPTYEKSYYRKLQILRETGRLEQAIHSVPLFIKNKQIQGLLKQVKEEHLNSMGMDQILQDLLEKKNHTIEFVKDAHAKFASRIIQEIQSGSSDNHLRVIGEKISNYYKYAKQNSLLGFLDSFLSKIHYLLVKQKQSPKYAQAYEILLQKFWRQYEQLAEPMFCTQISEIEIKTKEQYKIVKYCPLNKRLLHFLQVLLMSNPIKSQQTFQFALQMCTNLKLNFNSDQVSEVIYNILTKYINKIDNQMSRQTLKYIKRNFMLIDSLIKFHLIIDSKLCFEGLNKVKAFYLHYIYINSTSQNIDLSLTPFTRINNQLIVSHILQNIQNFLTIYLFQHFITKLDRNMVKELIPAIEQQLDVMKEINNIAKTNNKNNQLVQLEQQLVLIYSSLLLKIDLKHQSNKINISSIMRKCNKNDGSLSDMQINALLLLAISSKQNMIQILKQMSNVTYIISRFIASPFTEQIENVKIVTSFIYLLVINLQDEQEENFARKMGTTVQEIRKAKKIQGQKADEKVIKQLLESQTKFREHISKNWMDIIPNYCEMLSKIKDQSSLKKWGKILHQIGRIDHSRFFNPKILTIILQCYKYQKTAVGELLSIMCKKVNVGIIKYQYLQSITTILVQNIELSSDELVIFESLLGLINFTSNTSTKVNIPIKTISNAVFEENKYIVHAACSLLNNLLAVNEEQNGKQTNLKDIVQKYVNYYREQIENDEGISLSDYSHPSRVYCTLLSLAMVLDLEHIREFENWNNLELALLKIRTSRSQILYKCVWYMSMKGKALGKWWVKFQQDLAQLQVIDKQRWLKLQQYIKK